MSRIRCVVAAIAALATVAATGASAATPKTVTMHFFSKLVYVRISDVNGRPLPANFRPVLGDRLSLAYDNYAGNHKHHAKRATASDHAVCILVSSSRAICDATLAIGGAMILVDDYVLGVPTNKGTLTLKISGGTGRYRGARGTVSTSTAGDDLDLTIKVSS